MKNCWASSTKMKFFPLTDYMDCYHPQVCTQCLHKTWAVRFFAHSCTDLYEARAILLGRLGRHNQALETYVYRLQNYAKAEEYVDSLIFPNQFWSPHTRHCKRVYRAGTGTSGIFLELLKLYLRPTVQTSSNLLQPALELIGRHGPRLDAVETLQLLPPLVTADDIRPFLIESLRIPAFDTRVVREINKARNDQLSRRLMALQSRRVKVTDSRMLVLNIKLLEKMRPLIISFCFSCPQCHKRLGNSVIAVHAPRYVSIIYWFVHLRVFSDATIYAWLVAKWLIINVASLFLVTCLTLVDDSRRIHSWFSVPGYPTIFRNKNFTRKISKPPSPL